MTHEDIIDAAIALACDSVQTAGGGPFGAVVVRDGTIVGRGQNCVTVWNDPTAHAEIVAIRDAAKQLSTHVLDDCVLYSSCEPCPMCLAATYWARIPEIHYAATRQDAAAAGFDDRVIGEQLLLPNERKEIALQTVDHPETHKPFDLWRDKTDKVVY